MATDWNAIYENSIARRSGAAKRKAQPKQKPFNPELGATEAKIIRQATKPLNKTEKRFVLNVLEPWLREGKIQRVCPHESYGLPAGNGSKYHPDFPVWRDSRLVCYEVKGTFIRDDAIAKLKACASANPEIEFWLYQWTKNGWLCQRVES